MQNVDYSWGLGWTGTQLKRTLQIEPSESYKDEGNRMTWQHIDSNVLSVIKDVFFFSILCIILQRHRWPLIGFLKAEEKNKNITLHSAHTQSILKRALTQCTTRYSYVITQCLFCVGARSRCVRVTGQMLLFLSFFTQT